MAEYRIEFPDYYEDEEPIYEAKGYFSDATVVVGERRIRPTFYDPVRIAQTITHDLNSERGYSPYGALVVVPAVTRENIERAVERMSRADFRELLNPLGET